MRERVDVPQSRVALDSSDETHYEKGKKFQKKGRVREREREREIFCDCDCDLLAFK